jgi:hypothetical protein
MRPPGQTGDEDKDAAMTDEHNEAELRLRAADPAGPSRPLPPSRVPRAELLETIMTTTTESPAPPAAPSRTKWLLVAAAVVVAAASATTIALATNSGGGGGTHHPVATVAHLKMPAAAGPGRPGSTCIQLTVDLLRDRQVAFSGTAVDVTDTSVTLNVDHWYKGGTADQVELTNLGGVGPTTEGAITFTAGQRYLVSASDGTVGMCGYSGEYTPALAQLYDEAFGS